MIKNYEIYEVDYSCSPGGVNCWEIVESQPLAVPGDNFLKGDFSTLMDAVAYLTELFPKDELNLNIKSLEWWIANDELDHNCECIYCCPNGHCECSDCNEPCPQDCLDELEVEDN